MSVPGYWHFAKLTPSQTPILRDNETIHQLIDSVGLYQGEYKILNRQDGRLYLTSDRLIYIDNVDPVSQSLYVWLLDIASLSFYSGFLKSSPKITVLFKDCIDDQRQNMRDKIITDNEDVMPNVPSNQTSNTNENKSEVQWETAVWKCKICSFSNKISSEHYDFDVVVNPDLNSLVKVPKCENCGIMGKISGIASAIKKSRKQEQKKRKAKEENLIDLDGESEVGTNVSVVNNSNAAKKPNECPVCTFFNHPSMQNCEICGAKLASKKLAHRDEEIVMMNIEGNFEKEAFVQSYIKLSFRNQDNNHNLKSFLKKFQELIDNARLLDLMDKANTNKKVQKIIMPASSTLSHKLNMKNYVNNDTSLANIKAGITALETNQGHVIQNNQKILSSSLEDLNSLMSQAQELNKLIKSFDKILSTNTGNSGSNAKYRRALQLSKAVLGLHSSEDLGHIVLNNNFNFLNKLNNKEVFYKELARNLSVFILTYVFNNKEMMDNPEVVVTGEYSGGIISLTDLYSLYNRALGFNNNLISPSDLLEAVSLFESLKLPLIFRKFEKSGVMVIQDAKANDEEILNSVVELLVERKFKLQSCAHNMDANIVDDYEESINRGMNIQTLVRHCNLSIGILKEILDIGLMKGYLLIDENISGANYFLNELIDYEWKP